MLIGKNLAFKVVTPEDYPLIAKWFSDPNYMGNYYNIWPQTQNQMQRLSEETKGRGFYLIVSQEEKQAMGTIGYFNPFTYQGHQGLEIWYQVHPDFRNKGVATQAACLLINHLFDATPTERIQATVVIGNEASCRVLEKAGMQREGIYRRVSFLHGRYVDLHLYSIVRSDWKDEQAYRQTCSEF